MTCMNLIVSGGHLVTDGSTSAETELLFICFIICQNLVISLANSWSRHLKMNTTRGSFWTTSSHSLYIHYCYLTWSCRVLLHNFSCITCFNPLKFSHTTLMLKNNDICIRTWGRTRAPKLASMTSFLGDVDLSCAGMVLFESYPSALFNCDNMVV